MAGEEVLDHPAVRRVVAALANAGIEGRVQILADTARTVADAAAALGVTQAAIVKSLIFDAEGPVLVLASGGHQVDVESVGRQYGRPLRRADAAQVREATGMAIGGVAPVGHLTRLPVLVDRALAELDVVWAAAGHPHAVWPTTYAELIEITGGSPVTVAS